MLGITINDGCNSSIVPKGENEEVKTLVVSKEDTMLWHQILGNIWEKGLRALQGKGILKGMTN